MKYNAMKNTKKILCLVFLTASLSAVAQKIPKTPVENNGEGLGLMGGITQKQADAVAAMVRMNGYSCSSISNIRRFTAFSKNDGFTISCNNFKYEYEVEDVGGKWKVSVK